MKIKKSKNLSFVVMRRRMKNLKKHILTSILTTFFLSIFVLPLHAAGNLNLNYRIPNPTTFNSLEDIINAATALIRPAFILTFAAMVLYGAWTRLTGGDDDKKIQQSQKIIVGAAIGFAIAVLAPTIVSFLGKLLGVQGTLIN